jgi:hypothetical protein
MDGRVKYLTYTPWQGQLNNTRMCFETVLVLAYLTRRCLVTPAEYRRQHEPEVDDGKFRPLHPAECFTLESLDGIVPLITREEYDAHCRPGLACQLDLAFTPGTSVFCFPKIPAPQSLEDFRLRDFAASRCHFLEITPEMEACHTLNVRNATLEHYYSFFYFSQAQDDLDCKRFVREHVRFNAAITGAAQRIAATLVTYSALHVRRNDFFQLYPQQNVPIDRLLQNVRKLASVGSRLYIATDETDKSFFAGLRAYFELYFIDDFRSLLPQDLPADSIACVEQMICALANLFIGTKLSTYSAYITRLRGYHGAADKQTYFTDGSLGSEMDDQGSPPFSWINWVLSGNPWWGREFREGWEF